MGLGVAALDTGTGRRLGYRADERFAMCSTFKWMLAALVLRQVEHGALRLEERVPIGPGRSARAMRRRCRRILARGSMTIADLCAAAVRVSDNAAANLLLDRVGGPAGLTRFLRASGRQDHQARSAPSRG